MLQLLQTYLTEANATGYIIDPSEHPIVLVDRGTFIHIITFDSVNDGEWMVGRWYKATPTKSGDYSAHPDLLETTLEKCLEYVRDWQAM